MAEETTKEGGKNKRPVPKAPRGSGGSNASGFIALAVIAALLFASWKMNPNEARTKELSQTAFIAAVNAGEVKEVARIREIESGSTYLVGKLTKDDTAFRVGLVPPLPRPTTPFPPAHHQRRLARPSREDERRAGDQLQHRKRKGEHTQ